MQDIPHHNSTKSPMHVGPVTIMPGDTRMVNPIYLRKKVEDEEKKKSATHPDPSEILQLKGKKLAEKLEAMPEDELIKLDHLLNGTPGTPKNIQSAVVNERKNREAAAKTNQELTAYKESLSKMSNEDIQAELLVMVEDEGKLALIQQELSTRK